MFQNSCPFYMINRHTMKIRQGYIRLVLPTRDENPTLRSNRFPIIFAISRTLVTLLHVPLSFSSSCSVSLAFKLTVRWKSIRITVENCDLDKTLMRGIRMILLRIQDPTNMKIPILSHIFRTARFEKNANPKTL